LEKKCIILSQDVTFKENVFPTAENKKVDQFGVCEMSKNQIENHCHTVNIDIGSDGDSEVLSSFDSNSNDGSELGSSDESHDESACNVEDEDESEITENPNESIEGERQCIDDVENVAGEMVVEEAGLRR
jgi:hypothetical protein